MTAIPILYEKKIIRKVKGEYKYFFAGTFLGKKKKKVSHTPSMPILEVVWAKKKYCSPSYGSLSCNQCNNMSKIQFPKRLFFTCMSIYSGNTSKDLERIMEIIPFLSLYSLLSRTTVFPTLLCLSSYFTYSFKFKHTTFPVALVKCTKKSRTEVLEQVSLILTVTLPLIDPVYMSQVNCAWLL